VAGLDRHTDLGRVGFQGGDLGEQGVDGGRAVGDLGDLDHPLARSSQGDQVELLGPIDADTKQGAGRRPDRPAPIGPGGLRPNHRTGLTGRRRRAARNTPDATPPIPPDPAPTTAGGDHQRCGADPDIVPQQLDVPLDFDSMRQAGSGLGAGGFAVFDDSACMVQAAWRYSRFLFVESCGQCPACKFGTGEVTQTLQALEAGAGRGLRSTAASAVGAVPQLAGR
jgi:NADH-ubiquinone oxidoreductase-F iron-sulfur binding region